MKTKVITLLCLLFMIGATETTQAHKKGIISGKILSTTKEIMDFATVQLEGTSYGGATNEKGIYHLEAPAGEYTLTVKAMGYQTVSKKVTVRSGEHQKINLKIAPAEMELGEVQVQARHTDRIKKSAFNAIAVDLKDIAGLNKNLGDAIASVPGIKLRESGGVGSDMQVTLDGFSGKHVKVFIDGVPQEGVGSSFGLNNIPVNFADRIEVYRGVVPVGFGADAIGGVINIVTKQQRQSWFADAAYTFGSFNTHKSYINFGQTFRNGLTYEINAFQNYSDNNYWVDAPVQNFETGALNVKKLVRVQRFHDTYHNEAISGKVGVKGKSWADRMLFGFTFSNMYQDVQNGVKQKIVYGDKHRKGHSFMPSFEYAKRNLFTKGLDVVFTANYNRNATTQVDTSQYEYNWLGEKHLMNSRGEQSYQHMRSDNDNWNSTLTANYRLHDIHTFTLNHVFNAFRRSNTSLLAKEEQTDPIAKETRKNITGLSYRLMPSDKWNLTAFGKYYRQYVAGPLAEDETQSNYVRTEGINDFYGFGAAGTYFILPELQVKMSYERACRLPSIEETFGDEDLESGDIGIKPERSDNINLNLLFSKQMRKHGLFLEGGFVYRNTKDYIQRQLVSLSGGKEAAAYMNYGKVLTLGYNLSAKYNFSKWLSVGVNFTEMNVRDNEKMSGTSSVANPGYKSRMPNLPYRFADSFVTFYWRDLFQKGNTLTVNYDNQYLHQFCYVSELYGTNNSDYMVPNQFSHNLSLSYSLRNGRYSLTFECKNLTDEKLYDNFSLQKAGRAFYGKIRVFFGN